MKNITLTIGGALLLVNLLIGLLLSVYPLFNICFISMVIIITTLLLYLICSVKLKDGFIIGLYVLISFLGFVELILGIMSYDSIQDNGYLATTLILIAIQVISLVVCKVASKNL